MKKLLLIAVLLITIPLSVRTEATTAGCVTGELGSDVEGCCCVIHHKYRYCSGGTYITWDERECY